MCGNVSVADGVKRLFVGRALRSEHLGHTLLPKRIALPVFASDALSSNAYATQEILIVLTLGGASLLAYGPWIAVAVVVLYFTVIASYRQNVRAYPSGGGDYETVSANLGPKWGVLVASALLIDYVLTVAVSVSAAIANLGSTFQFVSDHNVWFAVGTVILITYINLRGVKESGSFFAIPTYLFIASVFIMIGTGIFRVLRGDEMLAESAAWEVIPDSAFVGLALAFLLARSFSSGTTALTGIEAIANGVPQFREPKSKNAATTLLLLGVLSMTMFVGITWLALTTQVKVTDSNASLIGLPEGQDQKTVIVQMAGAVFGNQLWAVVVIALVTALILALAANTAFNGFPVLGSILARDGYLPRQLHTRGDRLAYSNGILTLALLAVILIIVYQADVTGLIQLYIIGVFTAFSLSQFSMIRHWNRALRGSSGAERSQMIRSRLINGFGFVLTSLVLVIVLVTKFTRGAWIVVVAIPILVFIMWSIKRHYARVRVELATVTSDKMVLPARVHTLVLVSKIHKPTLRALAYARATRPTVLEAVTVNVDAVDTRDLVAEWSRREIPVTLRVLDSPYREVTRPIIDYVRSIRSDCPRDLITVFIPEYVVGHWWEQLLHNQSALRLKSRLLFMPNVMVTSVPWQLESSDARSTDGE
ncbi:MAG: APC family permease [Actinobacteria bacterium]|nr:APC family permease [Actinomycetota bacterium]